MIARNIDVIMGEYTTMIRYGLGVFLVCIFGGEAIANTAGGSAASSAQDEGAIVFQTGTKSCNHAVMRFNAVNSPADATPMELIFNAPDADASRFRPGVEGFDADSASLYTLTLPEGDYLVYGLACEVDKAVLVTPMEHDNPYAEFSVSAKRVNYIGQLFVEQRGFGVRLRVDDDYKAVKPKINADDFDGKKVKRKLAVADPMARTINNTIGYSQDHRDLSKFRTDFFVNGRKVYGGDVQ